MAARHNAGVKPNPAAPSRDEPVGLAPHAPLTRYYHDEEEHLRFLREMFDGTAPDYDRVERMLAFGTGPWYRRQALRRAGLAPGMHVLDVGTGTGLVAREALTLIGPTGRVTGVDPSAGMMAQAKLADVTLLQGRAEELPCGDATADFVTMGYALRHLSDLDRALSEFLRVLRPGGKLVILEITKPQGRMATLMLKGYMRAVVPMAARLVTRSADTATLWRYYWDTIEACIPAERVLDAMRRAGFIDVGHYVELGLFYEYTARKPNVA
jgi:demethylmenaquinone methyltransferase/2-methoxy-6-polyprenyl-1,4-benzoquinol methylase